MASKLSTALSFLASIASVSALTGTIADIEHVVLFMQENRAFDHYFGTMAGVRGFKDPNVQNNGGVHGTAGNPVWYQAVNDTLTLLPWYLNYQGGSAINATQCMTAGSNGWSANHAALNGDLNNNWPIGNTPYSWAHFARNELPNHFSIAEGWTVGDMYQESVIASTNPNRVSWVAGTIESTNGTSFYTDNNESPGCDEGSNNCYPLTMQTTPEKYEAASISWQVYQDLDNFDDNPLAWFKQYQTAAKTSPLSEKGMQYVGLKKFYADAAAGTLPEVSFIIGPAELSDHPAYRPVDGAWLWQKIVDTVTSSPKYSSTALIISYDETGGWGDHVTPFHSPPGTPGEWINDPYNGISTPIYTGPGFRVPFAIVSPWTRGGKVYTEHADHSSQIKFIEKWQAAKGKNITLASMAPWRRENMADLTKAFDFAHPDYSIPTPLNATYPPTDSSGNWNGYALCEAEFSNPRPAVPYGQQNASTALATESGYKGVRGQLTEGRYLTFELNGRALQFSNSTLASGAATSKHNTKSQRFVIHQKASNQFTLTSAVDGSAIKGPGPSNTTTFTINDQSFGKGYTLQNSAGQYLTILSTGQVQWQSQATGFQVFSVTYDD